MNLEYETTFNFVISMKNRSRNTKKDNKWFGLKKAEGDWEVHHIDRNPKNNQKSNLVCLPREVHVFFERKMQSYRGGPLPKEGYFPRKILAVKKDNWIKKNKWNGEDPNNGDVYSKGLLIKEGPKQLEMFR